MGIFFFLFFTKTKNFLIMRQFVILRGPSGSGKSTLAKRIIEDALKKYGKELDFVVLSSDDFFLDERGEYKFSVRLLGKAHFWNQKRCEKACEKRISLVIIDNCNLEAWEAHPYVKIAEKFAYKMELKDTQTDWKRDAKILCQKNVHQVPMDAIEHQLNRSEKYTLKDAKKARNGKSSKRLTSLEEKQLSESAERSVEELLKKNNQLENNDNNDNGTDDDDDNDKIDKIIETEKVVEKNNNINENNNDNKLNNNNNNNNSNLNNNDNSISIGNNEKNEKKFFKSIRIEIAINDGQKGRKKPWVLRDDDFEKFVEAACKSLKLNVNGKSFVY